MALPVHAAQRLGLGRAAADSARRRAMGRTSRANCWFRRAETASSMCSIAPTDRLLSAKPFVKQPDVGPRDRIRRPARADPGSGADAGRHSDLSLGTWRSQLVFDVVQPAHRLLLCADARELQCFRQEPSEWVALKSYMGRLHPSGARRAESENPARDRREDRKIGVGNIAARPRRGARRDARDRYRARVLLRRPGSLYCG